MVICTLAIAYITVHVCFVRDILLAVSESEICQAGLHEMLLASYDHTEKLQHI